MVVRFYSSTATPKNLVSSITAGTTVIQLSDSTGLPAQFPFTLALDYETPVEELVDVTAAAGTMYTITRAVDGTSATSHTAGAIVRHVSSARDFTDSRNHENSTTNVHGTAVGSAVVGTNDTQTLTNKTISGAALTGTFTGTVGGSPTFTGNPAFSGAPTFTGAAAFSGATAFNSNTAFTGEIDISNLIRSARTNPTDSVIEGRVIADANARWFVRENGETWWGPGNATQDLTLKRVGAGAMEIDGTLAVSSTNSSGVASHLEVITSGAAAANSKLLDLRGGGLPVLQVTNNGNATFTPQDTTIDGVDINMPVGSTGDILDMQENSTSVATFDSSGILRIYQGNTPLTYTPVMANGGSAAFSSAVGWYFIVGKLVHVTIYMVASVAGSGTTPITISLPTIPFRAGAGPGTTRQMISGNVAGVLSGGNSNLPGSHTGLVLAGGTTAVLDNIMGPTGLAMRGDNIGTSTIFTLEGWYREV